jgi:bifunctional DNase/RNase
MDAGGEAEGGEKMDLVEVRVSGLAIDERNKTPVVLLQENEGERVLPIWIGPAEASAIAMELTGKKFQRPLTHDLTKTIIDALQADLIRIDITDLKDNTFYAKLYLRRDAEVISIDARPSDSIALALRSEAPIFVSDGLLSVRPEEGESGDQAQTLRRNLQDLNLEDFGKFNM